MDWPFGCTRATQTEVFGW